MPQDVIRKCLHVTGGNAFVTSDVGQHQMFAAQYYLFDEPRRWINSGGLGTMGFGLPAAMGVKLAHPDADVACVTGEGSIQMNIQELSTCTHYGLPVKIINMNNGYLGMVKQWQDMQYAGPSLAQHLPGFAAGFREACRGLRPCRHAHRVEGGPASRRWNGPSR
jgi:acetolactate synthase-1/2/3 large subunit